MRALKISVSLPFILLLGLIFTPLGFLWGISKGFLKGGKEESEKYMDYLIDSVKEREREKDATL